LSTEGGKLFDLRVIHEKRRSVSGTRIHRSIHRSWFKKDQFVKKTGRVKKEKAIVASKRKEIDRPRLAESVRQALSRPAPLDLDKPAAGV
jgi:hypothetical protein